MRACPYNENEIEETNMGKLPKLLFVVACSTMLFSCKDNKHQEQVSSIIEEATKGDFSILWIRDNTRCLFEKKDSDFYFCNDADSWGNYYKYGKTTGKYTPYEINYEENEPTWVQREDLEEPLSYLDVLGWTDAAVFFDPDYFELEGQTPAEKNVKVGDFVGDRYDFGDGGFVVYCPEEKIVVQAQINRYDENEEPFSTYYEVLSFAHVVECLSDSPAHENHIKPELG